MSPVVLAQHSTATVEHGTPHEVVALARHALGVAEIHGDPCSSPYWNENVIRARNFWTERTSLLRYGSVRFGAGLTWFINPPGGLVREFWQFACDRYEEGSAVFWVGFALEQLTYLQMRGALFPGFRRLLPPRRLAFLRRPGDVFEDYNRRIKEATSTAKREALFAQRDRFYARHQDPNGPPVKGASPTHPNYLLLMPSEIDQVERFEGAARLMNAEAF